MCRTRIGHLRLFIILLGVFLSISPGNAKASACCKTTTGEGSLFLCCADVGIEAQIRSRGESPAALIRVHSGFDTTDDFGTHFTPGSIATVTGNIDGRKESVLLNAFIDRHGRINYTLSHRDELGTVTVTYDIAGSGNRCETTDKVIKFDKDSLPPETALFTREASTNSEQAAYSKLFGNDVADQRNVSIQR